MATRIKITDEAKCVVTINYGTSIIVAIKHFHHIQDENDLKFKNEKAAKAFYDVFTTFVKHGASYDVIMKQIQKIGFSIIEFESEQSLTEISNLIKKISI